MKKANYRTPIFSVISMLFRSFDDDKPTHNKCLGHSTNRLSAHSNTMGAPSRYLISSTYLPPLENAPSNILCSLLRNQQQRLATRLRKTSSKRTSSFLDVFLSARVPTHQLKGGATT